MRPAAPGKKSHREQQCAGAHGKAALERTAIKPPEQPDKGKHDKDLNVGQWELARNGIFQAEVRR